jgi:hypothetical protein
MSCYAGAIHTATFVAGFVEVCYAGRTNRTLILPPDAAFRTEKGDIHTAKRSGEYSADSFSGSRMIFVIGLLNEACRQKTQAAQQ